MITGHFKKLKSFFFRSDGQKLQRAKSAYIPFDAHSSIGGPSTFLKNLHGYLDKVSFPYVNSLGKAGVILFPIYYDQRALQKLKARGGKVCQRLDGVYYPEKHGDEFLKRNQKIKDIYLNFSDHVIFQSEYSRKQCFDMLGKKQASEYSIIINGVNTEIFHPNQSRGFNKNHIQFCTTGSIRGIDMLSPIIRALDLIQESIHFSFHVVGPIKDEECAKLMDRKYIVHHGNCPLDKVADILRSSDIFIFSHLNPPCPNSVIEAIASGLPVVGFNSGAMSELLSFAPDLLADAGEKLYHSFPDLSPELLAEKLMMAVDNYPTHRKLSLQACENYSMDNCGRRYVEVLEGLMNSLEGP